MIPATQNAYSTLQKHNAALADAPAAARRPPHFAPQGENPRFGAKYGVRRQGAWARWWGRCASTRMRLGRCPE